MHGAVKWGLGGAVSAGVSASAAFPAPIGSAMARSAIDARAGVDATQERAEGLHVASCGSGSPSPDPTRAGPCSVVI
ncbi:hypothetical protein OY671_007990, partial [Metschnikowia pulcherrima]